MRLTATALALACIPLAALAQPAPSGDPVVVITSWKCDLAQLNTVLEHRAARRWPLGQALVNEGLLLQFGALRHLWADEWNVVEYYAAADEAAFRAAHQAMDARYRERFPDDVAFEEACPARRTGVYAVRTGIAPQTPVDPEAPPVMALSAWQCDARELESFVAAAGERLMPVAQEVVDEGLLRSTGWLTRVSGDGWNLVRYTSAPDIPNLIAGLDAVGSLEAARYEGRTDLEGVPWLNAICSEHKDGIYTQLVETGPPSAE